MAKTRKTEIKLEVEEAIAMRSQRVLMAHCRWCRKRVPMIAANEAAMIAELRARQVYRLVEDGQLRFIEDQNGSLFVCFESLNQLDRTVRADMDEN